METLTVNGEPRDYAPQTVAELVAALGIDPARRGLAVAVNAKMVPRAAWGETRVSPGDRIEVVKPLAGG